MNKNRIIIPFLIWEFFLYGLFITIDFSTSFSISSSPIKYLSILSIFLYSLIICHLTNQKMVNGILIALFFVVIADYFLLFADNFVPGILLFILVQCTYFIYLKGYKAFLKGGFILLAITMIFIVVIHYKFQSVSLLSVPILIYLILTFINVVNYSRAILVANGNKKYILILLGILLLFLCDVHVGLSNLPRFFIINNEFLFHYIQLSGKLIWIFYLPSQLCICFSLMVKNQYDGKL